MGRVGVGSARPGALRLAPRGDARARRRRDPSRQPEAFLERRHGVDDLDALEDEAALAALTALVGIGQWSAEVFLMFCEGRTDFFPVGDVALREALRWLDGLEVRPTEKQAATRAAAWAPHRSTAAHLLWAWYGAVRRGALPRPQ